MGDLSQQLEHVYNVLYLEHVVKNPLYTPGDQFLFEPFTLALSRYMMSLKLLQS